MDLSEMQTKAVVRLVDDDRDFLKSMEIMLRMKGWQTRSYSGGDSFLQEERLKTPGCIILDLRMPGMTGLQMQAELEKMNASLLPVIFLSGHGDIETAVHTLKHGAFDFLEKPANPKKLFEIIEKAVARSLEFDKRDSSLKQAMDNFATLTKREKEVFLEAAKGASNKEIGELLGIGVGTVKMHRGNAFSKMNVHSPTEAANLIGRMGINA